MAPLLAASLLLLLAGPCLASTNQKGLDYLKAKEGEPGVVSLPSGLKYKVLRTGSGGFHPTVNSPCECHYEGKLIDGTKFDSSYDRGSPTTFAPNQVIKGWTEAMQLMVEGDKWEMYIPSELGYGDRGSPPKIGGGDVLVFQMEIINIKGDKVPAITCDVATLENCDERQAAFVKKQKAREEAGPGHLLKEIDRLAGMSGKKMNDDLRSWLNTRIHLLKKLQQGDGAGSAAGAATGEL